MENIEERLISLLIYKIFYLKKFGRSIDISKVRLDRIQMYEKHLKALILSLYIWLAKNVW